MADRFRQTYRIDIQFAEGEQPSAQKLNSINTQAKNGLALVERALGDVWNQAGDSVFGDIPLKITNLARNQGIQSLTNSRFPKPNLSGNVLYTQSMSIQDGQTEIKLDFVPEDDSTLSTWLADTGNFGGPPPNAHPSGSYDDNVGGRDEIADLNSWYLDVTTGTLYLGSPWNAGSYSDLQYNVDADNLPSDTLDKYGFNVIPHPDTVDTNWKGLKFVQVSTNTYLAYLPPIRPTSDVSSGLGKTIAPNSANTVDPADSGTFTRYWFASSTAWVSAAPTFPSAMSTDARWRYCLPEPLQDLLESGSATEGTVFSDGSLYLWDNTEQTIVEGLTYKVPDSATAYASLSPRASWVIQIEGAILDNMLSSIASSISTDEPADYNSRYSLITVGESLAKAIQDLNTNFMRDQHTTGLGRRIKHSSLTGLQSDDGSRSWSAIPPSYMENDDHVQYLHRHGAQSTSGSSTRDRYNNGMFGDFLMLSTNSSSNYQNSLAISNKIKWGHYTSGPSLYWDPADETSYTSISGVSATGALKLGSDMPLHLNSGALYLNGGGNGLENSNNSSKFRFFFTGRVDNSEIESGSFKAIGSTTNVSGATGSPANYASLSSSGGLSTVVLTGTTQSYVYLNSSSNKLLFGTTDSEHLEIHGYNSIFGAASSGFDGEVRIGSPNPGGNTNTHLRVNNRRVYLGTESDYLYHDGSSRFSFVEDGSIDTAILDLGNIETDKITKRGGNTITRVIPVQVINPWHINEIDSLTGSSLNSTINGEFLAAPYWVSVQQNASALGNHWYVYGVPNIGNGEITTVTGTLVQGSTPSASSTHYIEIGSTASGGCIAADTRSLSFTGGEVKSGTLWSSVGINVTAGGNTAIYVAVKVCSGNMLTGTPALSVDGLNLTVEYDDLWEALGIS